LTSFSLEAAELDRATMDANAMNNAFGQELFIVIFPVSNTSIFQHPPGMHETKRGRIITDGLRRR
jgi:hypothetical protein